MNINIIIFNSGKLTIFLVDTHYAEVHKIWLLNLYNTHFKPHRYKLSYVNYNNNNKYIVLT